MSAKRHDRRPCSVCGRPIALSGKLEMCRGCWEEQNLDSPFPMGGESRKKWGCIVSFESPTGERLTMHRQGPPREVVAAMCDTAIGWDDSYRVVAVSSPESIYRDLQGSREKYGDGRASHAISYPETQGHTVPRAMLHPRLLA